MARETRGRVMRSFTSSTSKQSLRLDPDTLTQHRLTSLYPASVEFSTVGAFGLTGTDGVDITYDNVAAGKEKVCSFTHLLATNDASNATDAEMTLVAIYN